MTETLGPELARVEAWTGRATIVIGLVMILGVTTVAIVWWNRSAMARVDARLQESIDLNRGVSVENQAMLQDARRHLDHNTERILAELRTVAPASLVQEIIARLDHCGCSFPETP